MAEKTIHLTVDEAGDRLDKYVSQQLTEHSRNQIQLWIDQELIHVNGETQKAKYKVQSNDEIVIEVPEPVEISTEAENIPLDIIYEDKHLAVVNKPQGMVVHPSAGHYSKTLVNALLYHLDNLSGINGEIRPGIVHRIDKDTSGLLMVAKDDITHNGLADQLKDKTTMREYQAIVHGGIEHNKGTIEAPIGRDPKNRKKYAVVEGGKDSVTHFEVIERLGKYTLVSLNLETGRTHQIRVHMDYIGHPVAGDGVYGPAKTLEGNGQFLHAKRLGFIHPITKEEMTFDSELPEIFQNTLSDIRNNIY